MRSAPPTVSENSKPQGAAHEKSGWEGNEVANRLAVCSWSLQPKSLHDLIAKLRDARFCRVQIALDPIRETPALWADLKRTFQEQNVSLVSGMFGCVGEDYSTLESIRTTGGIAPDPAWAQNLKNIRTTATLAETLGLKLVTFHAGFFPHNEEDPDFTKMLERLTVVAEIFAGKNIRLALETGQESASALAALLQTLNHPNLGVNFDPANMILYGKGDPIEGVRILGPRVWQVHIKDATHTKTPGTWGAEVVVGTGDVDWKNFFASLKKNNFTGGFVIEREAGNQRMADLCRAREVVLNSIA